jgi:hypothetical protein
LRAIYPTATNVIYLSISFSAVVKYLKPDNFSRYSYYHFLLNEHLTSYCMGLNATFDAFGKDLFPTTRSVEDLCFDFVIEDYVGETLGMLHHQETQKNY